MKAVGRHFTKVFIAGIVALLPIGGLALTVFYLETSLANDWVRAQWWYVPGLGIVAAAILIYLIGLTVSTFLGRWFWRAFDRLLDRLPALGALYRTLKQILGYGEGKDGMFLGVVLVPSGVHGATELGLVTGESHAIDGSSRTLTVFVPSSPTPTSGRLLIIDAAKVTPIDMPVSDALKALVSAGKSIDPDAALRPSAATNAPI
jgi:uncharacterized membrane protein